MLLCLQVLTNDSLLDYTVLINQTAIHSLPAVINQVNSALLRAATGDSSRGISLTRHPLPVLQSEKRQQVTQETGKVSSLRQDCLWAWEQAFCSALPVVQSNQIAAGHSKDG